MHCCSFFASQGSLALVPVGMWQIIIIYIYETIDRFFSFVWSLSHSDQTNLVGETCESTKVTIRGGISMHCLHSHYDMCS